MSDIAWCPPNVNCPCYTHLTTVVKRLQTDNERLTRQFAEHADRTADDTAALRDEVERLTRENAELRGYNSTVLDPHGALRAENETLLAANRDVMLHWDVLKADYERLRAALINVMVGGNSLAQIIGADHPPHGTPYGEALAHYGSGVKYEAWCCWNSIMQARAALEGK